MSPRILLSRDQFREAVFARDKGKCVCCGDAAVDAHHVIDRALFEDGGYYIDNGVSVCAPCHMKCESTEISVEQVRTAACIKHPVVPDHFEADQPYDKWGNPVLPNGQRMRGEIFDRENVQKALAQSGAISLFTTRAKYPRTPHAYWSIGGTSDDSRLSNFDRFVGKRVVQTIKMDGENSTLYRDYYHARSIDGRHHPSRDWLKAFWASIRDGIPDDWRVVGENLFAKHSIGYADLKSYFLGFSIWTNKNECLAWDDTLEWFDLLGIEPVETVYDGPFDEAVIRARSIPTGQEGTVTRLAAGFPYAQFRSSVFKVVRENHVQTDSHWMHGPVIRNELAGNEQAPDAQEESIKP